MIDIWVIIALVLLFLSVGLYIYITYRKEKVPEIYVKYTDVLEYDGYKQIRSDIQSSSKYIVYKKDIISVCLFFRGGELMFYKERFDKDGDGLMGSNVIDFHKIADFDMVFKDVIREYKLNKLC
jgi:hypothetical protein